MSKAVKFFEKSASSNLHIKKSLKDPDILSDFFNANLK